MANRGRLLAFGLVFVALALTVTGVVIAATNSNPGVLTKDPLALNGYPPKSAELLVSLSSGPGASLSARVNVDFTTNRVDAIVSFPLVITTVDIEARAIGGEVYLRSADDATGPWLSTAFSLPSLFGESLELTKPDVDLITGYRERVTTSGYDTTYHLSRSNVAVGSITGAAAGAVKLGSVHWAITVGAQGEAVASTLVVTSGTATTTLHAQVLSYNHSTPIVRPPSKEVTALKDSTLRTILKSKDLAKALLPLNLFSLGQATIS